MNKAQLVEALSTRLGEDKKRTAATVDALLDTVYRTDDARFEGLPGFPFEPHYVEQDGLCHYRALNGTGAA